MGHKIGYSQREYLITKAKTLQINNLRCLCFCYVFCLTLQIVHAQEIFKHNMLHRACGIIKVIVGDNDFPY